MRPPVTLTSAIASRVLFSSGETPFIAKLHRAAFHRYSKRWNKRLFKKPVRWIFDIAYHGLKLGGRQLITLNGPGSPIALTFDAQRLHIGRIVFPEHRDGYEPEVGALLEALLRGDRVFFDIGANGVTSPIMRPPLTAIGAQYMLLSRHRRHMPTWRILPTRQVMAIVFNAIGWLYRICRERAS